jgi:hypothetical protein
MSDTPTEPTPTEEQVPDEVQGEDTESQPETPNPRSPADQRRDNEDSLKEYVDAHENAAEESRGE